MFIDNILELQTLEIIAFILSVCHVVLIVEDQFADPYFYRLLQLAEILRPVLKRNSNEIIRTHSPHIVFILNKCNNYISPQERLLIKRSLVQMMMDTHFRIYSSLKQTNKIKIQTNLKHIVSDFKQQELNENLLIKLLQQTKIMENNDEIDKVNISFFCSEQKKNILRVIGKHILTYFTENLSIDCHNLKFSGLHRYGEVLAGFQLLILYQNMTYEKSYFFFHRPKTTLFEFETSRKTFSSSFEEDI